MSAIFDAYADYYDLLYRDKDYGAEARYVQGLLKRHGSAHGSLLELGCGTGAHAEQFADLGYRVHGIDASAAMVEQATRRATPRLKHLLHFEPGDARSVRLGSSFDAVIALFHVASYQNSNEDLAAMFMTAVTHLRPGGVFVFDFWYGPAVLSSQPEVRVKRLEDGEHSILRLAEPILDANSNCVDVRYTLLVNHRDGTQTRRFEETHRMRYLFLPELTLMLAAAGLHLVHAEGWMGTELGLSSWQAVALAVR